MAWTSKSEADNPWNAELDWDAENPSGVTTSQPIFDDATDQVVCLVVGTGWDDGDFDRRVNLIEAAPDLLAALQLVGMSAGFQYMTMETREVISAAIAKAGGAS